MSSDMQIWDSFEWRFYNDLGTDRNHAFFVGYDRSLNIKAAELARKIFTSERDEGKRYSIYNYLMSRSITGKALLCVYESNVSTCDHSYLTHEKVRKFTKAILEGNLKIKLTLVLVTQSGRLLFLNSHD